MFKNISGGKHGGLNLVYKINPNIVEANNEDIFMIKPGVGVSVYTGARTNFLTLQLFALYNRNFYFQKNLSFNGVGHNSFQLGVFIGFNAFEMKPIRNKNNND